MNRFDRPKTFAGSDAPAPGQAGHRAGAPNPDIDLGFEPASGAAGPTGYPPQVDVLFLGHEASYTGAPLALRELIRELIQTYSIRAAIVLDRAGPMVAEYRALAPVLLMPELIAKTGSFEQSLTRLAQWFAGTPNRKVVIASTVVVHPYLSHFASRNIPVLMWVHEMPESISEFFGGKPTMDRLAQHAKAFIFATDFSLRRNVAAFGLQQSVCKQIPYGVRLDPPSDSRDAIRATIRAELSMAPQTPLVLGCGTLEYRKGADLFVEVAAKVLKPYDAGDPGAPHFVWVGRTPDAPFTAKLRAQAARAGWQSHIHFIGERNPPAPYFQAGDLFLLCSRLESFGLVAMEAVGNGLPVVGFAGTTGAGESLTDGYGVLVPAFDTGAMAEQVRTWLEGQRTPPAGGHAFVLEHFNWKRCAREFHAQIVGATEAPAVQTSRAKTVVIVALGGPPLCGNRAEGTGLRAWGLAKSLRCCLPDHQVILGYNVFLDRVIQDGDYQGVRVERWDALNLKSLIARGSTVVLSFCMGGTSYDVVRWVRPDQQLVLDCYVPIYLEVCARNSPFVDQEYESYCRDLPYWNSSLRRGDLFLCANPPQQSFYQGVLAALGRLNPKTYQDAGLLLVPYGIDGDAPQPRSRPFSQLLGAGNADAWKVLWFGGVYPWFRIEILVEAIERINQRHPTHMAMIGAKNPFNHHPDFVNKHRELARLLSAPPVRDLIHVRDWVPFEQRADWYMDCDLIATLNEPGPENRVAWRTRLVDYIWAGMPVGTNGGDPLGEDLIACGAACRLDISSPQALADGLYQVLSRRDKLEEMKSRMQAFQPTLQWNKIIEPLGEAIKNRFRPGDWAATCAPTQIPIVFADGQVPPVKLTWLARHHRSRVALGALLTCYKPSTWRRTADWLRRRRMVGNILGLAHN